MPPTEWIAARYVKSLLSTDSGRQCRSMVLEKAGISSWRMDESSGRVSAEQYTRLLQVLWHRSHDECFGFTQNPLKPGTFAMMCQAIMACGRLEHAVRRCVRFYGLVTDDFRLEFHKEQSSARLELHIVKPLLGDLSFFTEAFFAVLIRLMSWLVDQQIMPLQIGLSYKASESGHSFENRFHGPIHYDQPFSSLTFSLPCLAEPLKREASELRELLARGPSVFLVDFKKESDYPSRLKAFLTRDAENLNKDLETCAKELGISSSSLRRKLREEGENFHTLRDGLRRRRAMYYLQQTHKSIDAIASLMGYSEPSTFHRAFRKWTGETPRSFRQGVKGQHDLEID